jgi:predicted nucleic acid-binding protein
MARLIQLLDAVPSLNLDEAGADAASEIRRSLERSGNSIGMADSLIAGIVIGNGAALLTRSRRHFERVPELRFD